MSTPSSMKATDVMVDSPSGWTLHFGCVIYRPTSDWRFWTIRAESLGFMD